MWRTWRTLPAPSFLSGRPYNLTDSVKRGLQYSLHARALISIVGGLMIPAAVSAEQSSVSPPAIGDAVSRSDHDEPGTDKDIVITGRRVPGSVISDVDPIAVLDQDAIRSIGATSIKALLERLKPLSTSASGGDPVILLNGRRMSGMGEIQSLPPEAMERTEILPEQEAARFGFPPTVRVMNFITKKRFRATTLQELAGVTSEGGGQTNYAEVSAARIDGPRRASLSVSHFRQNPVLQSERDIIPDPNALYAIGGTIAGVGGGSIDAALDSLAGTPVTVAAVPVNDALRRSLAGYAASANVPAVSNIGRYRSLLQRTDMIRVDGTIASPIGKAVDGSINLALEAQRVTGLNGLASALLTVPADNGSFPFADDVILYRYLPNAVLRQSNNSLNLHAAGTLQGGFRRWSWNLTTSYDRTRGVTRAEQGVPLELLQASIDNGGDPLAAVPLSIAALRLTDRSRTVTGTLVAKAVANGPLIRLPAGDAQVTVSADYARSNSSVRLTGLDLQSLDLTRTIAGGSVSANLPIASAQQGVLPFLGRLSLNATVGVSDVSNYGRLTSSNYGVNWSPVRPIQLTASINDARAAPAIALLTNPIVTTPNTPFFDFTTGTSVLVTTIAGGNPALAPERRRIMMLSAAVQPIKGKELRLTFDYLNTRIENQTTTLGSATSAFQAAYPGSFIRGPAGELISVDLRPINVANERERKLRTTLNFSTSIGRKPPPNPTGTQLTSPPVKPRPTVNLTIATTWRIDDRLTLREGMPSLDLLSGATLTGTGGRPRWETEGDFRGTIGPANVGLYGRLQGPTRIASDLPTSDLYFSGRTWLVPYATFDVEQIVNEPWGKKMSLQFTIENLLNDRINVRDRTGVTPNRFQAAYIDPIGRSVRLGVRKQF